MGDMITYIQEKGELTFEEWEFNDVDSLILSQLAYLNYPKICEKQFRVSLGELKEQYSEDFVSNVLNPEKNQELFYSASDSKRFGSLLLGFHIRIMDEINEKQFSAVTFRISKRVYYLAFRGTDGSFVGWKEDLNLSFSENVPAQLDAVCYLEGVSRKTRGVYMLGGHSKGGNLAVYAAMCCNKRAKKKIVSIYNHDGPGFLQEVFSREEYLQVSQLIHKTIPQTAIVGLLLEQHGDYFVIESQAFAFLQHDPFSWVVKDGSFVYIQSVSFFSEYTNKTINAWLNQMDMETRRLFVEALYQVLQSTNAKTFPELVAQGGKAMKKFVQGLRSTNPEVRKMLQHTIRELIRVSLHEMKDLISNRMTINKAIKQK